MSRLSMNSTYLPGMSTVTTVTNTSTSRSSRHSRDRNWSTPMVDIQSRRLPEPPPVDISSNSKRSSTTSKDLPVYSDAYSHVGLDSRRQLSEEDITDIGGYLQPTFSMSPHENHHPHPLASTPKGRRSPITKGDPGSIIPTESYQTSQEVRDQMSVNPSAPPQITIPTTEAQPLIRPNSVQV